VSYRFSNCSKRQLALSVFVAPIYISGENGRYGMPNAGIAYGGSACSGCFGGINSVGGAGIAPGGGGGGAGYAVGAYAGGIGAVGRVIIVY
jgi:hypothetical protein